MVEKSSGEENDPMDRADWNPVVTGRVGDTRLEQLQEELKEARMWARHGYELGQRSCTWADHGVAPAWLTDGWPFHFFSADEKKEVK